MKLFKLTTKDNYTTRKTLWGANVTHRIAHRRSEPELCTGDVIHAYDDLNLALLLNPIHADLCPFNIWEAEGEVVVRDWGKVGCFELTTIRRRPLPPWWDRQRKVCETFAELCANATDSSPDRVAARFVYEYAGEAIVSLLDYRAADLAALAASSASYTGEIDFKALAARAVEVVCER